MQSANGRSQASLSIVQPKVNVSAHNIKVPENI